MIKLREVEYNVSLAEDQQRLIIKPLSLDIKAGENLAVMGANGSGKTTFLKLLCGLIQPSSGMIKIDNLSTNDTKFRENFGRTVGMVFQNPDNQLLSVDVERELALGLENYSIPYKYLNSRVQDQIDNYNLEGLRSRLSSKLSGGEKQILATASTLILEPGIILFDESTAHLDRASRDRFYDMLEKLKADREITTMLVTQSFAEAELFERLLVFYDGLLVADCSPGDIVAKPELFEKYLIAPSGKMLIEKAAADLVQIAFESGNQSNDEEIEKNKSELLIEIESVNFDWDIRSKKPLINDLKMKVETGKIYGILGPTGCGKSTLALLLAGLIKPQSGKIKNESGRQKQADLVKLAAYQFQQPERGMFADTVFDEIAFAPKNLGMSDDEAELAVQQSMKSCGLNYKHMAAQSPFQLSGGEARMTAIASVVASSKKLMIFDEPTVALDAKNLNRMKSLLNDMIKLNRAVIIISHDSDFVFENCDDLYLYLDGKFVTDEKYKLYKHAELFEKAGSNIPSVIQLAQKAGQTEKFRSLKINSLSNPLCQKLMRTT